METPETDTERVLERLDSAIRETMMRLHRSRGEREEREYERAEWREERSELEARAEARSAVQVRAVANSVRLPLERALDRVTKILENPAFSGSEAHSEES